ncbi:hypothetical protein GCM10022405_02670 [Gibbsiella dentisursi]|uniref:Uncharacterized protein n=1 Tax=Gibbsiella dentisursi TaxID=796890 RepID=A0ABP7KLM4_9GAMM
MPATIAAEKLDTIKAILFTLVVAEYRFGNVLCPDREGFGRYNSVVFCGTVARARVRGRGRGP